MSRNWILTALCVVAFAFGWGLYDMTKAQPELPDCFCQDVDGDGNLDIVGTAIVGGVVTLSNFTTCTLRTDASGVVQCGAIGGSATAGATGDVQYSDGGSGHGAEAAFNYDSLLDFLELDGTMEVGAGEAGASLEPLYQTLRINRASADAGITMTIDTTEQAGIQVLTDEAQPNEKAVWQWLDSSDVLETYLGTSTQGNVPAFIWTIGQDTTTSCVTSTCTAFNGHGKMFECSETVGCIVYGGAQITGSFTAAGGTYEGAIVPDKENAHDSGSTSLNWRDTYTTEVILGINNQGLTGTHTGDDDVATLTDSAANWQTNELINGTVTNSTDSSSCTITANTGTTVTCTLAGGTDNDWDTGDSYTITNIDQIITFDGQTANETLMFDEGDSRFEFSDEVYLNPGMYIDRGSEPFIVFQESASAVSQVRGMSTGVKVTDGNGSLDYAQFEDRNLTLGRNTAADITITFDELSADETIHWDQADSCFEFSDDICVPGTAQLIGGKYALYHAWANFAAADTFMNMAGGSQPTATEGEHLTRAGSIVDAGCGCNICSTAATGWTMDFDIRINNTEVIDLDITGDTTPGGCPTETRFTVETTQARGVDTFSAGDWISIYGDEPAGGDPTINDCYCTVGVIFNN